MNQEQFFNALITQVLTGFIVFSIAKAHKLFNVLLFAILYLLVNLSILRLLYQMPQPDPLTEIATNGIPKWFHNMQIILEAPELLAGGLLARWIKIKKSTKRSIKRES